MNIRELLYTPEGGYFDTQVWLKLEPLIKDELEQRIGFVADGNRPNYERDVGFIQGLKWVLDGAKLAMKVK